MLLAVVMSNASMLLVVDVQSVDSCASRAVSGFLLVFPVEQGPHLSVDGVDDVAQGGQHGLAGPWVGTSCYQCLIV